MSLISNDYSKHCRQAIFSDTMEKRAFSALSAKMASILYPDVQKQAPVDPADHDRVPLRFDHRTVNADQLPAQARKKDKLVAEPKLANVPSP
jgi:hypothetical protein